jgi:hypothetical protein
MVFFPQNKTVELKRVRGKLFRRSEGYNDFLAPQKVQEE